jgi:hypothetical protein
VRICHWSLNPPDGGRRMVFDIFISYRHVDAEPVDALVAALRNRGLTVWQDQSEIAFGQGLSPKVAEGLAQSRMLVAWYSAAYPRSRACQWELTAAWLAAEGARELTGDRILVINPEPGVDHIHPVGLRDAKFLTLEDSDSLAGKIASRFRKDLPTFGRLRTEKAPDWPVAGMPTGSNRFVGRLAELWRIHGGLMGSLAPMTSGRTGGADLVQVLGMGGVGKSLLAEEYALRYGAAYPGGVFWFSATRPDGVEAGAAAAAGDRDRVQEQMLNLAFCLNLVTEPQPPPIIAARLRQYLAGRGRYLWVVDDLPADADQALLRQWQAPGGQGHTLITSRGSRLSGSGTLIRLERLDPDDALNLLTRIRKAETAEEKTAAAEILKLLGRHALAVDVSRAALGQVTFAVLLNELRSPSADALDLAGELAGELPNGHEAGIAATLLRSIDRLPPAALRLLQLAALLAVEPIPNGFLTEVPAEGSPLAAAATRQAVTREGLAEQPTPDSLAVHILVHRTIRFHRPPPADLRDRAVAVMTGIMEDADDISRHGPLIPLVPHAHSLCAGELDVDRVGLLDWLGRFHHVRGDWSTARRLQEQVVEAQRRLLGPEHPRTLISMGNLALTLSEHGDLTGARTLQKQVLTAHQRLLGPEHPDTLTSMNNLAETQRVLGDNAGARKLHQQVLTARQRLLGAEHPNTLTSMNNLALTLLAQGDLAGARTLHEQELEACQRLLGPEHPHTLTSMHNLAGNLYDQGETDAAIALATAAHDGAVRTLGKDHPNTQLFASNLALYRAAP